MRRRLSARSSLAALVACVLVAACGDDDASTSPDASQPRCGDGVVQGIEQCDDGNDSPNDACRTDCRFTCGDGEIAASEACDTGLLAGTPGSCPSTCDDDVACTTDQLIGAGCQAQCVHGAIGGFIAGDGCCPQGADINDDSDCPAGCGNGVVEAGETCDTGIAAGQPGSCPTGCDDGLACTTDTLMVPAGCQNQCVHAEITAIVNGDGCCPALADSTTDSDCSPSCGDGVVQAGAPEHETCDTKIVVGNPGACPTTCNDGSACTVDLTLSEGTCQAACSHTAKTTPVGGDGCCPPAANANNDSDCQPVCGNGVIESGEGCDDGELVNGDGCDDECQLEPTAFRIVHMEVRDPHVRYDANCADINDTVNQLINDAIGQDQDTPADGHLDLNAVILFHPLDQAAAASPMDMDLGASCTVATQATPTACQSTGAMLVPSTGTNQSSGQCLAPIAGTVNPNYAPPTVAPGAPCVVSDAESLDIDFNTFTVHLDDARIAATYVGAPATGLVDGLIRGFISQGAAEATILPAELPLVGGKSLADLLAGGGTCPEPGDPAGVDDRDMGPGGQLGWYFYINFTATRVPYTRL